MSDLSAEWTTRHNPGIRHGFDRRRDILAALLASDGEVARLGFSEIEHEGEYGRTKGEYTRVQILEIVRAISLIRLSDFISMI